MPLISSPFQAVKASIKNIRHPAPTCETMPTGLKSLDRDTVQIRFGDAPKEKGRIRKALDTVWTHLKASGKGAFTGFFNLKNWKYDAAYVGVGFLATLPFAAAIPGSHLVLLPLLYLGSRTINSVYRAGKGLIKPSWVQ